MPIIRRMVGQGRGGASEYLAPLFDATRVGTGITLSAGNSIATTTGVSDHKAAYLTVPAAGRVYGEVEITAITGSTNSIIGLFDDDPAQAGTPDGTPGAGLPGWGWRLDSGFSCTPPAGSNTDGDILQFKIDTASRSVELARNNGAYAAAATWTAAAGAITWRLGVYFYASSGASFRLPAVPIYTVPTGYVWFGNFYSPA
jgi:hypothetical protein